MFQRSLGLLSDKSWVLIRKHLIATRIFRTSIVSITNIFLLSRAPNACFWRSGFLALILSQCLCCRLVLNLRAPNHTQESATYSARSAPSRPNPSAPSYQRSNGFPVGSLAQMKSGAVNIPLHSFSQDDSEDYGGVKVHVDVETDSDRNRKQ